jgi:hypothetical protein
MSERSDALRDRPWVLRSRPIIVALLLIPASAFLVLMMTARTKPRPNDLSVVFVGLTNDPQKTMTPPRLAVISNGHGLHAVFAITNRSTDHYLQFGIDRIEKQVGDAWVEHPAGQTSVALGMRWLPGYGCAYAIPWPPGLPAETPWRVNMWVKREPGLHLGLVNQWLHREIFRPYGRHSSTSSVVPSLAVSLNPLELLSTNLPPR